MSFIGESSAGSARAPVALAIAFSAPFSTAARSVLCVASESTLLPPALKMAVAEPMSFAA